MRPLERSRHVIRDVHWYANAKIPLSVKRIEAVCRLTRVEGLQSAATVLIINFGAIALA